MAACRHCGHAIPLLSYLKPGASFRCPRCATECRKPLRTEITLIALCNIVGIGCGFLTLPLMAEFAPAMYASFWPRLAVYWTAALGGALVAAQLVWVRARL